MVNFNDIHPIQGSTSIFMEIRECINKRAVRQRDTTTHTDTNKLTDAPRQYID